MLLPVRINLEEDACTAERTVDYPHAVGAYSSAGRGSGGRRFTWCCPMHCVKGEEVHRRGVVRNKPNQLAFELRLSLC